MQAQSAGNGAHRARPNAKLLHCLSGCLNQSGVICQPKIVIGAKIEHLFAVNDHGRTLGGVHRGYVVVKSGFLQGFQFFIDPG